MALPGGKTEGTNMSTAASFRKEEAEQEQQRRDETRQLGEEQRQEEGDQGERERRAKMKRQRQIVGGVVSAFAAGAGLAMQASMNGALSEPLDSGLAATMFSFVAGNGALLLAFPFSFGLKKKKVEGTVHWWMWLIGGVIGAFYVTMGTFLGPRLGFSLFFVCVVTGQLLTSLLVDHVGFMGIPETAATKWRIGCLLTVLAGSIMAVVERLEVSDTEPGLLIGYIVLSVMAGVGVTAQAPINNAFTRRFGTLPHRTALLSFSFGGLLVTSLWAISVGVEGGTNFEFEETEFWMFLGGIIGALYVFASIALAHKLGVALFFISVVAGQLSMSLLIDTLGLFRSDKVDITGLRVGGILLVFVGAASFRLRR
ncbi:Uncharacterized protein SCF082_LOCUS10437 [Durusdinium trenchii]|uniref:Uncharacterized protein n=1 Tax=Durusdinium trenchii TaxID=1381693 RepID=A0ABP0J6B3_9DINO